MKKLFLYLTLCFVTGTAMSQETGKIAGKVIDKTTGETLIGVSIKVETTSNGVSTDVGGNYSIAGLAQGKYTLLFSYVGYQPQRITDITVFKGKVASIDVVMTEAASQTLQTVVVTATAGQASLASLYTAQKNSARVSDGISSEAIKRSPDKSAGEVLKRVSGTTIQDNKFVIVRGLSDRYNSAQLDNSPLPSTEPNRKAFSFDIVPSSVVDNIVISKTATPDLPADFAGGTVQIITKDIPDQNFISFALGYGYNSQTTFKDFSFGERTAADYLTFGGTNRKLPSGFPSSDAIIGKKLTSNQNIAAINSLNNQYTVQTRLGLPSQNYQFTIGRVAEIAKEKNRLGSTFSLTYRNSESRVPDVQRKFFTYNFRDQQYKFNSTIGALANFAYSYNKSKITFKNLYNRIFDDQFITRTGANAQTSSSDNRFFAYDLIEKSILKSTLEGEHQIGGHDARLKWNVSYSNIVNNQPDQRKVNYKQNTPGTPYYASNTNTGLENTRLFSNLSEDVFYGGTSYEQPVKFLNSKLKFGANANYRTRDFNVRFIGLNYDSQRATANQDRQRSLQTLYGRDLTNEGAYTLDELPNGNDRYSAHSLTGALYGMLDSRITDKLRIVYGFRAEKFDLGLTTSTSTNEVAALNDLDVLPSANLTYALTDKANFRLSYYRTLARPEFRELAPFAYYDYEEVLSVNGNPNLKRSMIDNADIRYELYPSAGQFISVSAFYKKFTDAIEVLVNPDNSTPIKTYFNSNQANVYGFELEARKTLDFLNDNKFLKNTTLYTNLSFSKSEVEEVDLNGNVRTRQLTGQSPYIINAGIHESIIKNMLTLNLLYNRIGSRLYSVGGKKIGDIYENSRGSLDAQLGLKAFKSKGEVKLNASNILNEFYNFYEVPIQSGDHNLSNSVGTFKKYQTGTDISLSFSYTF